MKQIDISTPKHPDTFALVDDDDHRRTSEHNWYAVERFGILYAERQITVDGKPTIIHMHREILGVPDGMFTDHRDGNGLNNQRYNIRACTPAQNSMNRRIGKNNTSGYKGVCWSKRGRKWQTTIKYKGKVIYIGRFFCIIKAAKAYDKAANKYFGEFANLNFPKATLKRKEAKK